LFRFVWFKSGEARPTTEVSTEEVKDEKSWAELAFVSRRRAEGRLVIPRPTPPLMLEKYVAGLRLV
jgi:hypothetical protein